VPLTGCQGGFRRRPPGGWERPAGGSDVAAMDRKLEAAYAGAGSIDKGGSTRAEERLDPRLTRRRRVACWNPRHRPRRGTGPVPRRWRRPRSRCSGCHRDDAVARQSGPLVGCDSRSTIDPPERRPPRSRSRQERLRTASGARSAKRPIRSSRTRRDRRPSETRRCPGVRSGCLRLRAEPLSKQSIGRSGRAVESTRTGEPSRRPEAPRPRE
jgi:hypothetical protein